MDPQEREEQKADEEARIKREADEDAAFWAMEKAREEEEARIEAFRKKRSFGVVFVVMLIAIVGPIMYCL